MSTFQQEGSLSNNGGGSASDDEDVKKELSEGGSPGEAPKKAGRRKINIEFIDDKSRRHITFSKRKAGIMKKAYELSTLTGTQVLLLVASETGHVYTFATPKLQPLITKPEGKNLIQSCLNAPEATSSTTSPPHHQGRLTQSNYNSDPPLLITGRNTNAPPQQPPPEQNKNYHMDVGQMNHMNMGYANSFQTPSTTSLNIMPSHMTNLSAYPPARYGMPTQATHPPVNSSGNSSTNSSTTSNNPPGPNQYSSSFPAPGGVPGMMQFSGGGGGGARFPNPNGPPYLWPVNNSAPNAQQHNDNKHNENAPREENIQLSKD